MNAACLVNKWIYFTSYNSNWLFKLNIDTKDIEAVHQLNGPKTGMKFSGLYYYNNQIWLNDPPKMVHRSTKLYPLPANQRALLL
jgi:hypothetical protein